MLPLTSHAITPSLRHMQRLQDPLTQREHPLALPEILISLRGFLNRNTLIVCLRVCREWHRTFLPFVWRKIFVTKNYGNRIGPDELKNHADLIVSIQVFSQRFDPIQLSIAFLDGLYCRNLTKLEFYHQEITVEFAAAFIQQHHSTLKSIRFESPDTDITFSDEFLDILDSCRQLETLKLPFGVIASQKWNTKRLLTDLWSRLRFLTASFIFEDDEEGLDDTTQGMEKGIDPESLSVQTKLEYLALYMPLQPASQTMLQLILASPGLKCLHWREGFGSNSRDWSTGSLADAVRSGHWTPNNLETLDLGGHEFSLRDFKVILGATPQLNKLDIEDSDFDKHYWHVLRFEHRQYLTQLRDLNIQDCWDVSGTIVQQILCEMPNLERFAAPYIDASDLLVDKRPWVCSKLRDLGLFFFLDDETGAEEGSRVVMAQLAKMDRLQHVELRMGSPIGIHHSHLRRAVENRENLLELSLARGLGQLKTLTRLRALSGTDDARAYSWTKAEAEWVLSNWVSLVSITDAKLSKEAANLLEQAGILVVGCIFP